MNEIYCQRKRVRQRVFDFVASFSSTLSSCFRPILFTRTSNGRGLRHAERTCKARLANLGQMGYSCSVRSDLRKPWKWGLTNFSQCKRLNLRKSPSLKRPAAAYKCVWPKLLDAIFWKFAPWHISFAIPGSFICLCALSLRPDGFTFAVHARCDGLFPCANSVSP